MDTASEPIKSIQELAASLLATHIDPEHEQDIIERIHELFSELVMVSGFDGAAEWHKDLQASSGMAISVNEAALCLLDFRRTGQFFRGLHQAIRDAQKLFSGQAIEVIYAGCGPYAPFFTLLAPLFSKKEIQFTLIEFNDESLIVARLLIRELGLQAYLRNSYLADATTFQVPNAEDFHILFTETMDAALEREPMVPILLNLLPQMRKDVLAVPRNVRVEGVFFRKADLTEGMDGLWDLTTEYPGHSIGTVLDMAETISRYLALPPPAGDVFHELQCPLPDQGQRDYFALLTTVEIWEDIFLFKNESDITDLRVRKMDDLPPCDFINFQYLLTEEPELKFGVS